MSKISSKTFKPGQGKPVVFNSNNYLFSEIWPKYNATSVLEGIEEVKLECLKDDDKDESE